MPIIHDDDAVLQSKIDKLAKLVQQSTSIVALTGAGISTTAGIPDFRSPTGTHYSSLFDFEKVKHAQPTIAHMVLAAMHESGKLPHVITANHDNLHQKAGMNDSSVVELHGNFFIEKCTNCGHIYHRDDVVQAVNGHFTNNKCTLKNCQGQLENNIIKFGEDMPPSILQKATDAAQRADLCIVLGTSMVVKPMNHIPYCAKRFVIVNLQEGPMDNEAWLVIRGTCDEVMSTLANKLGIAYSLPPPSTNNSVFSVPKWAVSAANEPRNGGSEVDEPDWE